jgi:hypothetical protein
VIGASLVLATPSPAIAGSRADSTHATSSAKGQTHYSAAACAAGYRIATIVRFPIGVGLGLAVCVAGIALDLDARLHRTTD